MLKQKAEVIDIAKEASDRMTVWVRIVALVEGGGEEPCRAIEVKATLGMTVYRTRAQAEKEHQQFGGIVLEVNAASLRGQSVNQDDVVLHDGVRIDIGAIGERNAFTAVNYADLPHKMVREAMCPEPQDESDYCHVPEFSPEAKAWLDSLQEQTGWEFAI